MTSRRLRNKDYKDDASVVDFIKNFHIDILLPRSALMQPQVSKIMRYSVLPFENGPSKGDSHHRATKKYAPRLRFKSLQRAAALRCASGSVRVSERDVIFLS